jgi:hypothetical protein
MPAPYDASEFVDTEAVVSSPRATPAPVQRPPSREELESQVLSAQSRLAELRRQQEELERERAAVEEARRRRVEFQTGREEMLHHLTRGVGLMEEAELSARRDAEQLARSLDGLQRALAAVRALDENAWTKENCSTELTRALTSIENARLEWNAARLKWPLLDGAPVTPGAPTPNAPAVSPVPAMATMSFGALCRMGFALTWPVALVVLIAVVVMLAR